MATIKKAQLGGLIRKAAKTVIKKTPKKTLSLAEKVEAKKLSGGLTKAEQKIGKDADKTLKELNINKYNESSSSPVKLTAEQKANNARILKEIREGKRKNGGAIKKAQNGRRTDANTTIQKAKLDNKYNKIYAAMKKDSTDLSNKVTLPSAYNSIRKETGKSPSAEELRKRTSEFNKALVKEGKKDKEVRAVFGKLDAKGRADNAMNKKNGGSVKRKMRNGGSLSGLTASNKRDKGIDPKGAYTTVQKRTLAGARGKAKLTADKQLGATKMAKRGMRISKKK
jgi:hypothetical protein